MNRLFSNRKGAYFFVIDVIIGLFIFLIAIFIITSYSRFSPSFGSVEQTMNALEYKFFRQPLTKVDPGNPFLAMLKENNSLYSSSFTVDEYVYVLYNNSDPVNASALLANLSTWLPANVGFNYTIDGLEIYSQQAASKTLEESGVKISSKKLTLVSANITTFYDLAITELVIWQ